MALAADYNSPKIDTLPDDLKELAEQLVNKKFKLAVDAPQVDRMDRAGYAGPQHEETWQVRFNGYPQYFQYNYDRYSSNPVKYMPQNMAETAIYNVGIGQGPRVSNEIEQKRINMEMACGGPVTVSINKGNIY